MSLTIDDNFEQKLNFNLQFEQPENYKTSMPYVPDDNHVLSGSGICEQRLRKGYKAVIANDIDHWCAESDGKSGVFTIFEDSVLEPDNSYYVPENCTILPPCYPTSYPDIPTTRDAYEELKAYESLLMEIIRELHQLEKEPTSRHIRCDT
ncbi:unnamed protein product [Brugia pahangi]|uniref:Peptidase S74 domain-containing protein n=1 Tax=Brugia pahangi TaxID=6280 RepID=A0A0N4TRP1_BRUPA|nr:unnamed protein product [Brugia pahangi]